MVRRQTRAQKRNRRQKTKRNNRRQNKTLRRKRQSRRKLRGGANQDTWSKQKMIEILAEAKNSDDMTNNNNELPYEKKKQIIGMRAKELGLHEDDYIILKDKSPSIIREAPSIIREAKALDLDVKEIFLKYKDDEAEGYKDDESKGAILLKKLLAQEFKIDIESYFETVDYEHYKLLNMSIYKYLTILNQHYNRHFSIVDNDIANKLGITKDKYDIIEKEARILGLNIKDFLDFAIEDRNEVTKKKATDIDLSPDEPIFKQESEKQEKLKEMNIKVEKYDIAKKFVKTLKEVSLDEILNNPKSFDRKKAEELNVGITIYKLMKYKANDIGVTVDEYKKAEDSAQEIGVTVDEIMAETFCVSIEKYKEIKSNVTRSIPVIKYIRNDESEKVEDKYGKYGPTQDDLPWETDMWLSNEDVDLYNNFIKNEASRLQISEEKFKDAIKRGKYMYSSTEYKNVGQKFSVYETLAKDDSIRLDDVVKHYIPAIDEAKVLGMSSIKDYMVFKTTSFFGKKSFMNTDGVDREFLKDLNKKNKKKMKLDVFKAKKAEAKILGITVEKYIELENESITKTDDKTQMEKLSINNKEVYNKMKEDAKLTGLTLVEVKEAIDKAKKRKVDKEIIFAEKVNLRKKEDYQNYKALAEKKNDSILNLVRIEEVNSLKENRKNREHQNQRDIRPQNIRMIQQKHAQTSINPLTTSFFGV